MELKAGGREEQTGQSWLGRLRGKSIGHGPSGYNLQSIGRREKHRQTGSKSCAFLAVFRSPLRQLSEAEEGSGRAALVKALHLCKHEYGPCSLLGSLGALERRHRGGRGPCLRGRRGFEERALTYSATSVGGSLR